MGTATIFPGIKLARKMVAVPIILVILFNTGFALAQDEADDLYDRERFAWADINKDGVLNKDEIRLAGSDFQYYLPRANFLYADSNHDGLLSISEIILRRQQEKLESQEMGKEMLYALRKNYEEEPGQNILADINWLKKRPAVAAELFGNWAWLNEHQDLAEALLKDKEWLTRYQEVIKGVLENRRFLVYRHDLFNILLENKRFLDDRPKLAARVYKFKEWMDRETDYAHKGLRN